MPPLHIRPSNAAGLLRRCRIVKPLGYSLAGVAAISTFISAGTTGFARGSFGLLDESANYCQRDQAIVLRKD